MVAKMSTRNRGVSGPDVVAVEHPKARRDRFRTVQIEFLDEAAWLEVAGPLEVVRAPDGALVLRRSDG